MKLFKKYMPFFLSIAVLTATSTHYIDAAKKEKKKKTFFTKLKKSFTRFFTGKWKQMSENDWLRVLGTTLFTGVSIYSSYWMFFKKSIVDKQHPRPKPRIVNSSPVFYNNQLNDQVTLRQVPAVPQGRNNTCGLHALLNGIKTVNALHADQNTLDNLRNVLINDQSQRLINERIRPEVRRQVDGQEQVTPAGFWRQLIINQRQELNRRAHTSNEQNRERIRRGEVRSQIENRPLNGENLTGAEVEQLIAFEQSNDERRLLAQNIPVGFTAYDSIAQIGHAIADIDMPSVVQNLTREGAYSHVFLIRAGGGNLGNGGHWYTVVLHKTEEGQHHYIAMDSSGKHNGYFNVAQDQGVLRIIRAIEGQEVVNILRPQPQQQQGANKNTSNSSTK